jgi:hypothetical protein
MASMANRVISTMRSPATGTMITRVTTRRRNMKTTTTNW